MALPIVQIARLLGQLTTIGPVVTDGVDKIRKLVESIRKGDGNIPGQLETLKQAIELQSAVNRKVEDQLQIVESVLKNVQRSLKIIAICSTAIAIVAVAALMVAILN
jgi:hypothetical protein